MILWKPDLEVIKKRIETKEKFRNYKGKDIGPFERICNHCNITIISHNCYDKMMKFEKLNKKCSVCNKGTKGQLGDFSKKCETCENLIYYKWKGDWINAIKKKTKCQFCVNKNLAIKYKNGLFPEKTKKEIKEIIKKQRKSFDRYWNEHPEKLDALVVRRKNFKCKFYYIAGLKCQGNSEKKYIESLVENNLPLPIRPKGLKTPIGFYFPDFEFEDKFIEIKSSYTFKMFKTCNKKQMKKITWVRKNIKPVVILIVD